MIRGVLAGAAVFMGGAFFQHEMNQQPQLVEKPVPVQAPASECHEEDACFDCNTMGSRICGPVSLSITDDGSGQWILRDVEGEPIAGGTGWNLESETAEAPEVVTIHKI